MSVIAATDRVVLIRIPQTGAAARTAEQLYDATRQWWHVAASRRDGGELSPTHALAVMDKVVVAAYRIDAWRDREQDSRWSFAGEEDPTLAERYLGADVSEFFPKGAQNPLRYVNGPPVLVDNREPDRHVVELEHALEELDTSPLAAVMYGQNELFHSNVLAWFFEQFPHGADRVFHPEGDASSAERQVLREHKHIDLWMNWSSGHSHAVENKVFSLPDLKQLERYARDVIQPDQPGATMTLLSLLDPQWQGDTYTVQGAGTWQYLSYRTLADRLEAAGVRSDGDYACQTVGRYAAMVRALDVVVRQSVAPRPDEGMDLPDWIIKRVASPQLLQRLRKMRARNVAALLAEDLQRALPIDVACTASYGRGGPHLTAVTPLHPGRELAPLVGLQIEASQFRLVAILPHLSKSRGGTLDERMAWGRAHSWVFEFTDKVADALEVADSTDMPPTKPFNKYDPDFIYRYRKVGQPAYEQLRLAAISHFTALAARVETSP
jgi:hypothetical protein